MKTPDMSAFKGKGFDIEYTLVSPKRGIWQIWDDYDPDLDSDCICTYQRPRLNKPQVLDDWSWVPDGFVWKNIYGARLTSSKVRRMQKNRLVDDPVWYECIGVTPEYEEWGKLHGMEVVET